MTRRWKNSKHTKYKNIVPSISHNLRAILKGIIPEKEFSKISRLKTGHSML